MNCVPSFMKSLGISAISLIWSDITIGLRNREKVDCLRLESLLLRKSGMRQRQLWESVVQSGPWLTRSRQEFFEGRCVCFPKWNLTSLPRLCSAAVCLLHHLGPLLLSLTSNKSSNYIPSTFFSERLFASNCREHSHL